ncbi:MAG: nucleotide sugar dehydrogenase [Alphaproteobacteria bacterium]|nr:nucleotide sugar dehydrogenase [Alphaproteobacteria bacterium]
MKLSVFGLGYVGSVSAACFADMGHSVIGVDPNHEKVDCINAGVSPIVEPGLDALMAWNVGQGRLAATTSAEEAILKSDISFICVGTPSRNGGSFDFQYLGRACHEIAAPLAQKNSFHVTVVRSTVLPGTLKQLVLPALEFQSGKKAGEDFGLCHNPEFMREGSAIEDFRNPPKTVISASDERSADALEELYRSLPGPIIRCPMEVGEMVKYADNAWHASKVAFANEIGRFCKAAGVDSHEVMRIFCQDTKLNLSPYYLKPGFAFGGSCLPKDLRALTSQAQKMDIPMPLLDSVMASNNAQIELGIDMIRAAGKKSVGILGFSFKAGTDDMRESPIIRVIERLLVLGFDVKIYDRNVRLDKITGANRNYIEKALPQIESIMATSIEEVLAHADVIVIGNNAPEFATIVNWLRPEQQVIDFVRIKPIEQAHDNYSGICW